jgi:IS30 family transposase
VQLPDDERMRLSHKSICRAIYMRSGGQLRTGAADPSADQPGAAPAPGPPENGGARSQALSIHDRPEEIEQRLIPCHQAGDLIVEQPSIQLRDRHHRQGLGKVG